MLREKFIKGFLSHVHKWQSRKWTDFLDTYRTFLSTRASLWYYITSRIRTRGLHCSTAPKWLERKCVRNRIPLCHFILNPAKKGNGSDMGEEEPCSRVIELVEDSLLAPISPMPYITSSVYSGFHCKQGESRLSRMGLKNSNTLFPYWPLYSFI